MQTQAKGARKQLLRMSHIEKTFRGNVVALRDLDLTLNQGDFMSLLGPSGCGKSTALRLISGLMTPTSGSIDWHQAEFGQRGGTFVATPLRVRTSFTVNLRHSLSSAQRVADVVVGASEQEAR